MHCSEEGCKEPAVYSYVRPWGAEGACCSVHRVHVQQNADALGHGLVNFTVLDPGRPQELSRDERTTLIAARMSAEEEADRSKARAANLFQENNVLREELRRLKARDIEAVRQLADRDATIEKLMSERDAARADAGEAQQEVAELRAMLPRATPPALRPNL